MDIKYKIARLPLHPLSLAIACLAAQSAAADTAESQTVILVEGKPEMTEEYAEQPDASALEQLRAATRDSASLLRDVPGVSLNNAGGVSSLPSIRGLADDRLRIKVDGTDLIASCPNHMNPPLSYVDPNDLEAIKVYAGITPVSLGGDSIGGTIVAERKAPTFALPGEDSLTEGEIGGSYQSNNNAFGTNLKLTHATEHLSLSYSGSWSKADNYSAGDDFKTFTDTGRDGHSLDLDEVGSTAWDTQNHALGIAYQQGRDLFELRYSYQDMAEQLYPNQRMDLLDNEQRLLNLAWTRDYDWGQLKTRIYHESVDHEMDFGDDKQYEYGTAYGMPMNTESETTGASLQADIDLTPDQVLRLGTELQRYQLDDYWPASGSGMMSPDTFENINDGERDRAALFAEVETRHSEQWTTLAGVRYERVHTEADAVHGYSSETMMTAQGTEAAAFNASDRSQTDHNVDLTALARYRVSDTLDMEMGLARKVRSPSLYERYTWSSWAMAAVMNNFVGDGNGYVGDVDLKPETAYTLSTKFDWHAPDHRWTFTATPFYTHVDNYIDAIATDSWSDDQYNVLQYSNQTARLYGIDLSLELPLASNRWGEWGLRGLINYTDGKNKDTGDGLYNIMPLNGRFTLTQRLNGWDNALEWVVVDEKDDVSDLRNEIPTAGYALLNLRASHSWQNLRLDFGVENLFDRFYYLPTGGTYTAQGKTMSINGIPWGIAVPGMGRSAYVSFNYRF